MSEPWFYLGVTEYILQLTKHVTCKYLTLIFIQYILNWFIDWPIDKSSEQLKSAEMKRNTFFMNFDLK